MSSKKFGIYVIKVGVYGLSVMTQESGYMNRRLKLIDAHR